MSETTPPYILKFIEETRLKQAESIIETIVSSSLLTIGKDSDNMYHAYIFYDIEDACKDDLPIIQSDMIHNLELALSYGFEFNIIQEACENVCDRLNDVLGYDASLVYNEDDTDYPFYEFDIGLKDKEKEGDF